MLPRCQQQCDSRGRMVLPPWSHTASSNAVPAGVRSSDDAPPTEPRPPTLMVLTSACSLSGKSTTLSPAGKQGGVGREVGRGWGFGRWLLLPLLLAHVLQGSARQKAKERRTCDGSDALDDVLSWVDGAGADDDVTCAQAGVGGF